MLHLLMVTGLQPSTPGIYYWLTILNYELIGLPVPMLLNRDKFNYISTLQ
jgi:hypothetical protein